MRRFLLESLVSGTGSKYLRIARAIIADIQRGRFRPGDRLPSTRELSKMLRVHRKTAVLAYSELARQGWVETERARLTRVRHDLPKPKPQARGTRKNHEVPLTSGFALPPAALPEFGTLRREGLLLLLGGIPELRFAKDLPFAQAYGRSLRGISGRRLLDYGDPQGEPVLRAALAELLRRTRAIPCSADNTVIVRGSQAGLYIIARTLLNPGDCVAVEALAYPAALDALRSAGVQLLPIPVDANGMNIDRLANVSKRCQVRAVYLTPHHHVPTTVTLIHARRNQLLELATRERLLIIEDDYDHEFQYGKPPVLPLASRDTSGQVVYVGTLSKTVAPGLRIGFVVLPRDAISRVVSYRAAVDRQGDQLLERAVATLMEDGELERHIRRACRAYEHRRDALAEALKLQLPELSFRVPDGGMAIWAKVKGGVDVDAWVKRSADAGVAFQAGSLFAFDRKPLPYVRLGFAACNETELKEAVTRMAGTLRPSRTSR